MNTLRRLRDHRSLGVLAALGGTALLTSVLAPNRADVGLLNGGLLYLLLCLLVAATWGWQVGIFAALLTNLTFNYFFIPPVHHLTVQNSGDAVALVVFIVVAMVGGQLVSSAQRSAADARRRAAEAQVLLDLSRLMIGQTDPNQALVALCEQVANVFDAKGASVLDAGAGGWQVIAAAGWEAARRPPDVEEGAMAQHVAVQGTTMMLGETGLHRGSRRRIVFSGRRPPPRRAVALVPLLIGGRTLGVLRLDGPVGATPFSDHPLGLLSAFAAEAALAVERAELAQSATHAEALRQTDEMKNALLASVSHDLKTPLATIKASVSSLMDVEIDWSDEDVAAFLATIDSQVDRLSRFISEVLDLNRLESGAIRPVWSIFSAREALLEARARTGEALAGRAVHVDAPSDLLMRADETLLIQALVNLIENAAKYSKAGGAISLLARGAGARVELVVADEGPGIPAADVPHVFEPFYRVSDRARDVRGSGLGLAIAKGFVDISGGAMRVDSSPAGTRFIVDLPVASDELAGVHG